MRCRSQTPAQGTRDGHSCGPSPHMPLRCHHGVTSTPCTPSRCYSGMATSPDISTMPKVASAVNIPSYAQSSHSREGTAQASLDEDEALEDDFQTPHMPVCHVMLLMFSWGKAGIFQRKPGAAGRVLSRRWRGRGDAGNS